MADEYRIRTVADFAAVPADKIDECLADFALFLKMARAAPQVDQQLQMAFDVEPGQVNLDAGVFHWIDDGRREVSALEFFARDTGQTVGRVNIPPADQAAPAAVVRDGVYWETQTQVAAQIRQQAHEAFERGDHAESTRLYLKALDTEQQPR